MPFSPVCAGCGKDIDDMGSVQVCVDCAEALVAKLEKTAHSSSHNSAMDAILALYGKWRTSIGKDCDASIADSFIAWAQAQHSDFSFDSELENINP